MSKIKIRDGEVAVTARINAYDRFHEAVSSGVNYALMKQEKWDNIVRKGKDRKTVTMTADFYDNYLRERIIDAVLFEICESFEWPDRFDD